jgi:hypothetical protein
MSQGGCAASLSFKLKLKQAPGAPQLKLQTYTHFQIKNPAERAGLGIWKRETWMQGGGGGVRI